MHSYVLETERLILRPLTIGDAEAMFVWLSDPEVNHFMTYPLYTDVAEARRWIASLDTLEDNCIFGIVRKEDGLLIGSVGIHPCASEPGCWSVGYNLRRDCWGRGYATESTRAILDFARRTLGAREFFAQHAVANPASGRVMEKCGFVYDRDLTYAKTDGSEIFPAKGYHLHLD